MQILRNFKRDPLHSVFTTIYTLCQNTPENNTQQQVMQHQNTFKQQESKKAGKQESRKAGVAYQSTPSTGACLFAIQPVIRPPFPLLNAKWLKSLPFTFCQSKHFKKSSNISFGQSSAMRERLNKS